MRIFMCCLLAAGLIGCKMKDDPEPAKAEKADNRGMQQPGAIVNTKTIPEVEARLVEWPKAKQQIPGLEVVENKVEGSDPISVAASAYVSLAAKAEVNNFKHNLDIAVAANEGRPLSFKEFQELARQCRIQFQNQPAYRYYGYDTKTGGIVVLEDKIEKKRIYDAKGIPWDE